MDAKQQEFPLKLDGFGGIQNAAVAAINSALGEVLYEIAHSPALRDATPEQITERINLGLKDAVCSVGIVEAYLKEATAALKPPPEPSRNA